MDQAPIVIKLEEKLGFKLKHISQLEGYMRNKYPASYLEVMTPAEEMGGSMYSKYAFTDEAGKLIGLNLFNCQLESAQLDFLNEIDMSHVKSLNLVQNKLTTFNLSSQYSSLQVANFSENASLSVLGIDPGCSSLARLELMNCNLQQFNVPHTLDQLFYLDLSKNSELSYFEIDGGLEGLQVLLVRGTALKEVHFKGEFPELVYLYLNANQLEEVHFERPFPKVRTLQLRKNQLKDFSERYVHFGDGTIENDGFWESFREYFPALQAVFTGENPIEDSVLATKLVDEASSNNIETLQKHFEQRKAGVEEDNECKVLLIGNGSAGKTNILNRLLPHRTFNQKWDSTHGIKIEKYKKDPYILYFWDFGGQDIYHSTHRLFMQQDAVYILAWKKATETETQTPHEITQDSGKPLLRFYNNFKLRYWLEYARQLGKESPMLVVQTNIKADGILKDQLQGLKKAYEEHFPSVYEFLHVESDPNQDLGKSYRLLELAIEKAVVAIKEGKPDIAKPLFKLREHIRSLQLNSSQQHFMSQQEYLRVANDLGVNEPMRELKTWLFRTGVVYFREGVFDDQIVLQQDWAINAIYALFDRNDLRLNEIRENRGEFSGEKLRQIWAEEYGDPEIQELLVGFMKECDICYEIEVEEERPSFEQRKFVAPKLLPDKRPKPWEDKIKSEIFAQAEASHHVKLSYAFLHEKLMEGILARTAYLALDYLMWQYGTRISEGEGVLYVERQGDDLLIHFNKEGMRLYFKLRELVKELEDEAPQLLVSKDGRTYEPLEEGSSEEQSLKSFFFSFGGGAAVEGETQQRYRGDGGGGEAKPEADKRFKRDAKQPIQEMPTEAIRALVENDDLLEAAQLLKKHIVPHKKNTVSEVIARLNKINAAFAAGYIKFEEEDQKTNLIRKQLLDLLEGKDELKDMAEEELAKSPNSILPEESRPPSHSVTTPGRRRIQILSASPMDKDRIQADKEFRELEKEFKQGDFSNNFEFLQWRPALDFPTIQRVARRRPEIIHFSGHGEREGIQLIGANDEAVTLGDENVESIFGRLRGLTKLVILNACHSSRQAKLISEFGMHVIGCKYAVLDDAAIAFSSGFYSALGDGEDKQYAFQDGRDRVRHYYPGEAHLFEVWFKGEKLNW